MNMNNKVIAQYEKYEIFELFRKEMIKSESEKNIFDRTSSLYEECVSLIPMIINRCRIMEEYRFLVEYRKEYTNSLSLKKYCESFILKCNRLCSIKEKLRMYGYAQAQALRILKQLHKNSLSYKIISEFYMDCIKEIKAIMR